MSDKKKKIIYTTEYWPFYDIEDWNGGQEEYYVVREFDCEERGVLTF